MKPYLTLDMITIALAVLGVIIFYKDLMSGNLNIILILYFLIIAIGYFMIMNKIHAHTKSIMKKVAEKLNCEFIEGGKYSLTHFIKCNDMEIKINLRGSYTPSSLHIIFYGNFNEADVRASNLSSQNFIKMLNEFQFKYHIKVNDSYISRNKAEAIITRFPYDAAKLENIIREFKNIILMV